MQRKKFTLPIMVIMILLVTACDNGDGPDLNQLRTGFTQPLFETDHKIVNRCPDTNPNRNAYLVICMYTPLTRLMPMHSAP